MQHPILKVSHLSHRYAKAWAIQDINFEINKTGIVGLLGSNGAGKSTTMNICCGVLKQTEGNITINGIDIRTNPEEAKKQIGFLPQTLPLYMDLTVDEYLVHCAHLRLVEKKKVKSALQDAKERCGITNFGKRLIRNLSGGYRQRVGIAQSIIHWPKLVVMDEPTNGLDPNQILEVRSLIKEIAKERAVIFSTHILPEVQVLCKDILMIEGGKIVFADSINAFNNYVEPHSVILQMENPPVENDFLKLPGVKNVDFITDQRIRLYFDIGQEIAETIITASVEHGWKLREINFEKSSLDEIFAQLSNQSKKYNN